MNRNLRYIALSVAISLVTLHCHAFDGVVTIKKALEGSKHQMKVDSFVTISNFHFFDTAYSNHIDTPHRVKNIVTLKIDESSDIFLGTAFTATVQVRLIYSNAASVVDSVDKTFVINYDRNGKYTSKSSFVFYGAQSVTARIRTISITGASGNNIDSIPAALMLENEMHAEPKYQFSCSSSVVTSLSFSDSAFFKPDELFVWWSNVRGADEYDLEWAYIDSSAFYSGRYGDTSTPNVNKIFKNNATRISTSNLEYAIPLIYDNTGKLFFRVRAIQTNGHRRIEANWSSVSIAGLGKYSFAGHERKLNWQSSISFAEDGKRKVVVQYFDGSLRSRQTVTKDNTSKTTVVSESFYDFQGRAVVQVLPAPTLNTIIQFTKNFNVGLNGAEYEKIRYDTLTSASAYCSSGADAMGTQSGASRYYSPGNPDQSGFNAYIPDAEGYPFVQTEYTQDNTGRISKQGGVGPAFRLGSSHETKYFYSTPSQEELDAIFGTEVGDKSHYFKTMVRDANGQYSISYTDMHGRTIATALAGTPPDSIGLQTLASNTTSSIKERISDPASVIIKDLIMEHKKGIAVEKAGNYVFNYSLDPQTLEKEACNAAIVCYDCLYDLRITVTDDCNNQRLPGGKAFDTTIRNFSLTSPTLDTSCTKDSSFSVNFTLFLPEGSYDVTKQLSVSRYAMNYYRDSVFLKKNICKTLAQFIQEQKDSLRARLDCYADCQSCRDSVGVWSTFRLKYMQNAGIPVADTANYRGEAWTAFNAALESCKTLCDSLADNDDIRTAMLLDVTAPSGQYANPDSGWTDKYSVFYTSDSTKPSPYQRDTTVYLNEAGQVDLVFDYTTGQQVKPNELDSTEFSTRFKTSWANSLLKYHPEYCKLVEYEKYNASHFWDRNKFERTNTYAEAVSQGFLNPTNNSGTPFNNFTGNATLKDPLSNTTSFKNSLEAQLTNYKGTGLSMWSMACIMVKCESGNTTCHNFYSSVANTFDTSMCQADLDMAWQFFRQMYLQEKKFIIDNVINTACDASLSAQLFAAGHFVHFNNYNEALGQYGLGYLTNGSGGANTNTTSVINTATGVLNSFLDNNCDTYVSQWIQQLAPCNYDTDSVNLVIIPRLLQVCKEGIDRNHPFGASSVKPGSTNFYRSFEEVLEEYNQQHGITNSYICSPELITTPKPYGLQTAMAAKPVDSKPDSCECAKITSLHNEFQSQGIDTSFSAFLLRTRNTLMNENDLENLRILCTADSTSCNNLQPAISLPPALQCATEQVCIPCEKMVILYKTFRAKHPSLQPTISATTSLQEEVNQFFALFMNNRLNYRLTAGDYLLFMEECEIDINTGVRNPLRCELLERTNAQFSDWYYNLEEPRPFVKGAFVSFFNAAHKTTFCYEDILALYDACGLGAVAVEIAGEEQLPVLDSVQDCSLLLNFLGEFLNYYDQIEGLKPFVIVAFTQYFNNYFGTCLDRTAINNFYYTHCGEFLHEINPLFETYDLESCATLLQIIHDFENGGYDGMPEPRLMTRGAFAVYYNTLMGTQFTYTQIDSIALQCGQALEDINDLFDISVITDCNVLGDIRDEFGHYYSHVTGDPLPLCTTAFEEFFHSYFAPSFNDSYDYNWYNIIQIDSLYKSNCFDLLLPCAGNYPIPSDEYFCSEVHNELLPTFGDHYRALPPLVPSPIDAFVNYWNESYYYPLSKKNFIYLYNKACGGSLEDSLSGLEYITGPVLCGRTEPTLTPIEPDSITNCSDSTFFAVSLGTELYNHYLDSLKNSFEKDYVSKCMNAYQYETFTVTHQFNIYHYTLYYYDQAGNLVKTVPPKGVDVQLDSSWFNTVGNARSSGTTVTPDHSLVTQYRYNTLNQVIAQKTPDAGISRFWYDNLGRLILSQNAKQILNDQCSYTLYDALGRITEVGQAESFEQNSNIDLSSNSPLSYSAFFDSITQLYRTQITRTVYDEEYSPLQPVMKARHLRNRVAWTAYYESSADLSNNAHSSATFYTYDIHGNVDTLIQDYKKGLMAEAGNRFKKLVYQYDLVSGKVNHVAYQPGEADAFYHKYYYDAENRLTNVETSKDSVHWENDAFYRYYKHGPLARTVLGQQQVQGIDYAYTLQGWLKGVNGSAIADYVNNGSDMGKDGFNSSTVARDAYSFALYYYGNRDYKQINTTNTAFAPVESHVSNSGFKPLFNGNIAGMSTNIPKVGDHLFNAYSYDQLNRLVGMQVHNGFNNSSNSWGGMSAINDYKENISYDANGNILGYLRKGISSQSLSMDSMNYKYYSGTNRLKTVRDSVRSNAYSIDIDDQDTLNYTYDAIGNLISDVQEQIDSITWTVYGKIGSIHKSNGLNIWYSYDAAGNRISKRVVNGSADTTTWYVRDASGNVMAVYRGKTSISDTVLQQDEIHLYGSSRLGIINVNVDVANIVYPDITNMPVLGTGTTFTFTRGEKLFELSNHLGNVLVTVSDKKSGHDDGTGHVDYYEADVVSASDYAPFGMHLVGRSYSSGEYRYGFNGKENDNEVKGGGNQQDYGMRIYDIRIGRFLSIDPLLHSYPELTPYQFASNRPIDGIDLDGLEHITANRSLVNIFVGVFEFNGKKYIYGSVSMDYEKVSGETRTWLSTPDYQSTGNSIGTAHSGVVLTFSEKGYHEAVQAKTQQVLDQTSDINKVKPNSLAPVSKVDHVKNQKTPRFLKKTSGQASPSQKTVTIPLAGSAKAMPALKGLLDFTEYAIKYIYETRVKQDFEEAQTQAKNAQFVVEDIKIAMDNNYFSAFSTEGFDRTLDQFANYMLDGTEPMTSVSYFENGKWHTKTEVDRSLLNKFSKVKSQIEQKRRQDAQQQCTNQSTSPCQ